MTVHTMANYQHIARIMTETANICISRNCPVLCRPGVAPGCPIWYDCRRQSGLDEWSRKCSRKPQKISYAKNPARFMVPHAKYAVPSGTSNFTTSTIWKASVIIGVAADSTRIHFVCESQFRIPRISFFCARGVIPRLNPLSIACLNFHHRKRPV